jgi:Tol biopolymer transport system component
MRLALFAVSASLLAQSAAAQAPPPVATREVKNVVPANAPVEQFVMTTDSMRTYYRLTTGGIWMYDRKTGTTSRISDATVWDLTISRTNDLLAFVKEGDNRREQHVWLLPLVKATGLPMGKEVRPSSHPGDVPAFSPDGKWVAFARDDETGVGQSVVVMNISGLGEHAVAPSQPSGVSSIRWTPDGKTCYFGVNPPVPFTCAESCLTGARESRPPSTIRRVSWLGGAVETLATVGLPGPGLSPDGKYLVFGDTGAPRRLVVADANGKRITTFSPPASQNAHGWAGASTLLTLATGQVTRLRTLTLPDGAPRVLFENTDFNREPSWSPDGRAVAVIRLATPAAN